MEALEALRAGAALGFGEEAAADALAPGGGVDEQVLDLGVGAIGGEQGGEAQDRAAVGGVRDERVGDVFGRELARLGQGQEFGRVVAQARDARSFSSPSASRSSDVAGRTIMGRPAA